VIEMQLKKDFPLK